MIYTYLPFIILSSLPCLQFDFLLVSVRLIEESEHDDKRCILTVDSIQRQMCGDVVEIPPWQEGQSV